MREVGDETNMPSFPSYNAVLPHIPIPEQTFPEEYKTFE